MLAGIYVVHLQYHHHFWKLNFMRMLSNEENRVHVSMHVVDKRAELNWAATSISKCYVRSANTYHSHVHPFDVTSTKIELHNLLACCVSAVQIVINGNVK